MNEPAAGAKTLAQKSDTTPGLLGVACGLGAALFWALGFVATRHGLKVGFRPVDLTAAFSVLPLIVGQSASTGEGIHDIRARSSRRRVRRAVWYPGSNRQTPMFTRLDPERGPADHGVFLAQYALSALRDRKRSPFNDALFISRHFSDRILNVGRRTRTEISPDNVAKKREITLAERAQILVDEFEISAEIVKSIPPDEEATL